jgi:hypothetical protein
VTEKVRKIREYNKKESKRIKERKMKRVNRDK